ncbi:MAG: MFS transporter [Anaerolineales bacterium]
MLSRLFQSNIPPEHRWNFIHLYFDIGWYGVLAGSSVNFLNIYATRLGANGFEIGLLTAMGAIVSLTLAIPSGHWVEARPIGKAVFWSSVVYRIGFLLWIPLPWLFGNSGQIWALIILALLMAIPVTPLSVGFNALFASAVPNEYRAHVAGIRNVVLSITYMISSIGSGYLLNKLAFPFGYQVVFGIGFFGAAMSSLHLYLIKPIAIPDVKTLHPSPKPIQSPEITTRRSSFFSAIRADVWQTPFRVVLFALLLFHLTQNLPLPIFPLIQVNVLHLTDNQIGIGSAIFYFILLIGSTQLRSMVQKIGNQKVTAIGILTMALYPIGMALASTPLHFYVTSAIGGLASALATGAYANYLLEHIPANDRPAYLAWYNVILNLCVLVGSLAGPLIANAIGLTTALFIFAAARILAGIAIFKWGSPLNTIQPVAASHLS